MLYPCVAEREGEPKGRPMGRPQRAPVIFAFSPPLVYSSDAVMYIRLLHLPAIAVGEMVGRRKRILSFAIEIEIGFPRPRS